MGSPEPPKIRRAAIPSMIFGASWVLWTGQFSSAGPLKINGDHHKTIKITENHWNLMKVNGNHGKSITIHGKSMKILRKSMKTRHLLILPLLPLLSIILSFLSIFPILPILPPILKALKQPIIWVGTTECAEPLNPPGHACPIGRVKSCYLKEHIDQLITMINSSIRSTHFVRWSMQCFACNVQ